MADEEDYAQLSVSAKTPLSAMANAFEELADFLQQRTPEEELQLGTFCNACSCVSVLFNCLGLAFKFAEMEYIAKIQLDNDIAKQTVKTPGSHTRNLRRVRQGLDLIRALFGNFLAPEYAFMLLHFLKEAASTAYAQVCAPYHTWAVRTAVSAGMYTLPTREQLLEKLNETSESAEKRMRRYINASGPVIEYIDKLYIKRNITLDW